MYGLVGTTGFLLSVVGLVIPTAMSASAPRKTRAISAKLSRRRKAVSSSSASSSSVTRPDQSALPLNDENDSLSLPGLSTSHDSESDLSESSSIVDQIRPISSSTSKSRSLSTSSSSSSASSESSTKQQVPVQLIEPVPLFARFPQSSPCQKTGRESLESVRSALRLSPITRSASFSSFCPRHRHHDNNVNRPRLRLFPTPTATEPTLLPSEQHETEHSEEKKQKKTRRLSNAIFHPRSHSKERRATSETYIRPTIVIPEQDQLSVSSPLSSPPASPSSSSRSPCPSTAFVKHFCPSQHQVPRRARRTASDSSFSSSSPTSTSHSSELSAGKPLSYGALDRHRTMAMVRQEREREARDSFLDISH